MTIKILYFVYNIKHVPIIIFVTLNYTVSKLPEASKIISNLNDIWNVIYSNAELT